MDLKEQRLYVGMTQLEVAIRLNLPVKTYAAIERGDRAIPKDMAKSICEVLEIETKDMVQYIVDLHIGKYSL